MKSGRWFGALLCLLAGIASAQTTPVQVTAKLVDGSNNASREAFLHFELGNCGPNFPLTPGIATVAKTSFDLKPNQPNGSILGQVIGYDQILCGNIASTQYTVTPMKDAVTPLGVGKHYLICSSSAPANTQCSNQVAGLFDLATAQPMDQPVQPGYVQLFGNPVKDQLWKQPTGTKATFVGTFDFTNANLIGISGGGGGGGISSVGGTLPITVTVGSSPVVSIAKSDSTHDGYISSSDWNTFNSKGIGSVTSVGITVPQGLAISSCPITGSGTCAISLNGQFPVSSLGTGSPNSVTWLNGSGAWTSPLTYLGTAVTSLTAGSNIAFTPTGNSLSIASTSAVTYPIAAPEGSASVPQYSFAIHPEIGIAAVLADGSSLPIRSVQVLGPTPPNNIIVTLSSPVNVLRWSVGDTFRLAALTATNNLNTLNGITFTATAVGQTSPTGTVTFSATTSIATATYATTAGTASNWALSIDAHTFLFNRGKSTTSNSSRTGTFQFARRDAVKGRAGAIDDTGIDIAELRLGAAQSPTSGVGAGIITSSGTNNSGASSITVAKGAGASWSAKNGDYILIDQANGDADLQMYKVTADTTVTQGTTTSLPITPALRTNITAGVLVVASWSRTQLGDASGVEILGSMTITDLADGCLSITSGLVGSTACGGGGAVAGGDKDIQFNDGGSAFGVETGQFTYTKTTRILKVGTMTVQGLSTIPNQTTYNIGAVTCSAPGAGKSAWCFDTDGFFKVSENNGAYFRPGNGAGSGNVVIQGVPTAGQTAEWSDGTHVAGIAVTGTNSYVKATAPTISLPKLDQINDVNGKLALTIAATVNAVDGLCLTNAATASPAVVSLTGCGTDPNVSINFVSKGTGTIQCNGVACGGGGSSFTNLFQTDANTITQRNATVTQVYQVMDSYTDAANYQGLAVGGNYVKTVKAGTGAALAFQFGVHGTAFRGWQVATNLDLLPFNTASAPNIGSAANRIAGLFAASADFTGAVTATVTNDTVTGTTLNKLAKLTGAPSKAIIAGTSDTDDFEGIVTGGAGLSGSATLAQAGFASCVFDAATVAGDYVQNSSTVAGDCHDAGSTRPASGKIVGRVQSTNVSAGTYSVLLQLDIGGGLGGGAGTVTSVSTSGGAPLFSAVVNNPTTTPQIVFTASNSAPNTIYANATGSSAPPSFVQPLLTGSLFSSQGTSTQVLIGNASGNLSFGAVNAGSMLTGNLAVAQFAGGVGANASTVWCGNLTWCTPAGGGNVSVAGTTPVAGQSTEWASGTTVRAVSNTGSGLVVRQASATLNNPLIPSIKDASGNPAIDIIATLAAVDSFTVTNAATGSPTVGLGVQGSDANIGLQLSGKGTGAVGVTGPITASGVTGFYAGPQGIDPGKCASGVDAFYASSANLYLTMCNNGGVQQKIIGSSADINTSDQVVGFHLPFTRAGDVAYNNGSTWTNFAGNNSGTAYLCENSSGVPAWCTSTSGVAWSSLQTPASNLTLAMAGFTSTFNTTSALASFFTWANTTSATLATAQSSPFLNVSGQYWTGAASAADTWSLQTSVANGTNGASTLAFTHSGSTGIALLSAPGFKATGTTALIAVESAAPTGVIGSDIIYADSATHAWKMINNNGSGVPLIGTSGSVVSGNILSYSGTSGSLAVDATIAATSLVTSSSNFVNGEVLIAGGTNKTALSGSILGSNLVQASANIVSGDVALGNGVKGLTDSNVLGANLNFSTVNVTTDSIAVGSANSRQLKDSGILITNTFHTGTKTDVLNTATYCVDAGANDTYACNLSPAVTSYVSGKTRACFLANTINTGAASINFNGVGALPIKVPLRGSITANPLDGDIQASDIVCGVYDGTNFIMTSQPTVALSTFPSATLNGSLVFFNASNWATFAGNASGTKFLQEDASGNLSWAAGTSTTALSSIIAAAGSNTINNGDNAQRWNSSLTTSGNVFFRLSENTAAVAAGTPWLFQVDSIAASTANIAKFTALGTSNGVGVLKTGFLSSLGTGGIDSGMLHCDVTDTTKCMQFTLSGITTATTRAVTIANGASTTVIADTGASNNFLTAISATGVISKAQPSIASLSDGANVPTAASNFSSKGFVFGNAADKTLASTAQCAANTLPHGNGSSNPTCSAIVAADITASTITGSQIASGIALAGSPTTTTQSAKDNSTKIATTAYVDAPTPLTAGSSVTLTAPRQYFVCTTTCTITVPVPAAGYEFCILNTDNVATVITLSAIGSSARYENTARTAYGTAGTGTFVSGGAVGDKVCLLGLDSTHYLTASFSGTWTAN